MKPRWILFFGLTIVMTCFSINSAIAAETAKRQIRQQKRIHQGIASGELTKGEVRRMERQQVKIQRAKQRAKSDGQVTVAERARLNARQDRSSARIYKMKHNDNAQ